MTSGEGGGRSPNLRHSLNPLETNIGHQWGLTLGLASVFGDRQMLSREERNPLSDWWWTVDRPLLGAIMALMLSGVILSLAGSGSIPSISSTTTSCSCCRPSS
jgi:hypothetical protein